MEALIERHGAFIRSLVRRFLSNSPDFEDAVQDIYIALWNGADRFDAERGSETTFVATLTRRRLIDRMRRARRRLDVQPIDEASEMAGGESSQNLDVLEEGALARRALYALPLSQRRVLASSLLSGMTHVEIAASTRLPLGTVKSHARRGLKRLREALGAKLQPLCA